jgi:hypothetical protein
VVNVLEALRFLKLEARLYNASSCECFGNTGPEPPKNALSTPAVPMRWARRRHIGPWQTTTRSIRRVPKAEPVLALLASRLDRDDEAEFDLISSSTHLDDLLGGGRA